MAMPRFNLVVHTVALQAAGFAEGIEQTAAICVSLVPQWQCVLFGTADIVRVFTADLSQTFESSAPHGSADRG